MNNSITTEKEYTPDFLYK